MSEEEQEQKKKKKKKKQLTILEAEKVESELLPELVKVLDELEKEKKYVDIQVCPKYKCRECGWRERRVLKATNKPTTVRDVVIMAEAKDADIERKRKEK